MARSKDTGKDDVQESVFPDGYQMNAWDDGGREVDMAASRSRVDNRTPTSFRRHKGRTDFPIEQIPSDMQYIQATNTLLNEPQYDNLQELYENGYDFVKQSSHPTYMIKELYRNEDNRIRRGACVLMKKPKNDYLDEQRSNQEESIRKQKDVLANTDYFGSPAGQPRFVVENSGSYTPSYSDRRG